MKRTRAPIALFYYLKTLQIGRRAADVVCAMANPADKTKDYLAMWDMLEFAGEWRVAICALGGKYGVPSPARVAAIHDWFDAHRTELAPIGETTDGEIGEIIDAKFPAAPVPAYVPPRGRKSGLCVELYAGHCPRGGGLEYARRNDGMWFVREYRFNGHGAGWSRWQCAHNGYTPNVRDQRQTSGLGRIRLPV